MIMLKFHVMSQLERVREANDQLRKVTAKHNSDIGWVMRRLLLEASRTRMSVEEVARYSGYTPKRIRIMMRQFGLDPKTGRHLLAKRAAEILSDNAELLGIEPHEMDLMSPLAYLPMGQKLREEIEAAGVSHVTEIPDGGYDEAKDRIETALLIGLDAGEISLPREDVPQVAAWLASEGIE